MPDNTKTIIRRTINTHIKGIDEVTRTITFIASDETLDRYQEVIAYNSWDLSAFKKNPVFLWAHDYHSLPIGVVKAWVDKQAKALMASVRFPEPGLYEFADQVFNLFKEGFLRAVSVGFIATKWENGDGKTVPWYRKYTGTELIELSAVPVPANPSALVNAVERSIIPSPSYLDDIQLPRVKTPNNPACWGEICGRITPCVSPSARGILDWLEEDDPSIDIDTGTGMEEIQRLCKDLEGVVQLLNQKVERPHPVSHGSDDNLEKGVWPGYSQILGEKKDQERNFDDYLGVLKQPEKVDPIERATELIQQLRSD